MTKRNVFSELECEGWWTFPRALLCVIAFVVILFVACFLITGGSFATYKFWAPKYENARREVFVNTNSYIQGKTEYLSRLRLEYESSKDEDRKAALRTLIVTEAETVDMNKLPSDLQNFVRSIGGQR